MSTDRLSVEKSKSVVLRDSSEKVSKRNFTRFILRAAYSFAIIAFLFAPSRVYCKSPCQDNPEKCPEPASTETTRGLAMGTGARASAVSTSSLAYNDSAMPLAKLYHIEGNFDYQPNVDLFGIGGAIVDSSTSPLAAGVSCKGYLENGERGYKGIDVNLGLGYPIADVFSIGLGGRYINLWSKHGQNGDEGNERYDSEGFKLTKGFTMDGSMTLSPMEGLHIAALAYNIIDRHSAYVPLMVGGSVTMAFAQSFDIGVDTLTDISSFKKGQVLVGGGGEYLAASAVPLRIGYRYDSGRDTHAVTAGVGFTNENLGADLSLRQQFLGGKDTRLMAAVRVYIN